jgi:putative ABC transport system permease protein
MNWLKQLFSRRRLYNDLSDEIRDHLDEKIEELVSTGLPRKEATAAARRQFGNITLVEQDSREVWQWTTIESLFADLRFAVRTLRKTPAFTATAILTLALGIGANTAIFTLIDALMLRTLPVRDPGQLVELLHRFPGEPELSGFSQQSYQLMRDHNHVFSGLIATTHEAFELRGSGFEPRTVEGGFVDGNYFEVLGLQPALGRLISPEDDRADHPEAVAVVSWSYWKNALNLDSSIIGKQISLEDVPVTVVGVAPRGFVGLSRESSQDIWLPLAVAQLHPRPGGWGSIALVGRLKPGVSFAEARADMAVLFFSTVETPNPNPFLRNMKFEMEPASAGLSSPLRQQFTTPLLVLMSVVSVLLLIACTNIASLLLTRGAAAQHEMALRVALGAGQLRLVRLVLAEPLLISAAGSLLALVLAYFGAGALARIILSRQGTRGMPPQFEIQVNPDLHVLLFTAAVALLTVLLSGLSPALRVLSTLPASALRQAGSAGESRLRRLFGKGLVVTQVALSVVLFSAAALFIGYLSNLEHLNLDFRRDHLLLVSLDSSKSGYQEDQLPRLYQELLGRLEAIPGVRSATLSSMTPISGRARVCYCVSVEGREEKPENHRDMVFINSVAPNYFETYGTPLLSGREFTQQDQNGPRAAMINQTMASYYFGDRSPVGKRLSFDLDDKPYEIVGVVGDAKYNDIREAPPHTIYLDTFQESRVSSQITLRTSLDPDALAPEVRSLTASLLKSIPVAKITTMNDQVDASIAPERLIVMLSGWFGALGALLVAIGLYGLLSYAVARRVNEIGVRMALGATRSDVSRMVLGEALRMVSGGLLIGTPVAFWAKTLATHLIHDLPSRSATPIALGAAAMIAVALMAAYLPARRASRVEPTVALRYE